MAALTKHTEQSVSRNLRHNTHDYPEGYSPSNTDIDPERTHLNRALHPADRGLDPTDCSLSLKYYHERMKEVYKMDRKDTVCTAEWCVTAPPDLEPGKEMEFFESSYRFLNQMYGGEKNCIQCICHFDEGVKNAEGVIVAGRPHMHYTFIVTKEVDNTRLYNEKFASLTEKFQRELEGPVTAKQKQQYELKYKDNPEGYRKEVLRNHEKAVKRLQDSEKYKYPEKLDFQSLNKEHLASFHPKFQRWINSNGPSCTVNSGVTGGMNRTVSELKEETRIREVTRLKERVAELEREKTIAESKDAEKIRSLESSLSEERGRSESYAHEYSKLKSTAENIWAQLTGEREKTASLEARLESEHSRSESLEAQNRNAQAKLQTMESALDKSYSERQTLQQQLDAERERSRQLEAKLQEKEVALEQAQQPQTKSNEETRSWGSSEGWGTGTKTKTEEFTW